MKKEPLIIENQGSFAIGGKTKKHEGVFSTDHFLTPEGQIAYGDHAYVFYQIPVHARPYPLVFSMVVPSASGRGNRHLMAVRDSKISFFARDTLRIS
jgi:hypothetical protein